MSAVGRDVLRAMQSRSARHCAHMYLSGACPRGVVRQPNGSLRYNAIVWAAQVGTEAVALRGSVNNRR